MSVSQPSPESRLRLVGLVRVLSGLVGGLLELVGMLLGLVGEHVARFSHKWDVGEWEEGKGGSG